MGKREKAALGLGDEGSKALELLKQAEKLLSSPAGMTMRSRSPGPAGTTRSLPGWGFDEVRGDMVVRIPAPAISPRSA